MNTITLQPELTELNALNEFITDNLPEEDFQVNFIVEEIFVNIASYSKTEFVTVNVEYADQTLTMEFVDNGIEFNPLLKEDPEIPESIEEANVGGLGIFLTKNLADEISYEHINGENHLTVIKKLQ